MESDIAPFEGRFQARLGLPANAGAKGRQRNAGGYKRKRPPRRTGFVAVSGEHVQGAAPNSSRDCATAVIFGVFRDRDVDGAQSLASNERNSFARVELPQRARLSMPES
jgi:hypothetical protein